MFENRYSRQSFLGIDSDKKIANCCVGIVGLGGGGSQIVQQLAHIGFLNYVIYDGDSIERSNLNRLIGATIDDADISISKIDIAKRMIYGLQPYANVESIKMRWQENPYPLRKCDIVFGCVDGFAERRALEICTRRFLIPLIDIGIDVHIVEGEPPVMSGQVFLSMPGGLCLTCIGFLNEINLAKEATQYGDAGFRPQVVWANGVLASTAIGIAVDLLTGWTKSLSKIVYLSYDSNSGIIKEHTRVKYLADIECKHFQKEQVGDPVFKKM